MGLRNQGFKSAWGIREVLRKIKPNGGKVQALGGLAGKSQRGTRRKTEGSAVQRTKKTGTTTRPDFKKLNAEGRSSETSGQGKNRLKGGGELRKKCLARYGQSTNLKGFHESAIPLARESKVRGESLFSSAIRDHNRSQQSRQGDGGEFCWKQGMIGARRRSLTSGG